MASERIATRVYFGESDEMNACRKIELSKRFELQDRKDINKVLGVMLDITPTILEECISKNDTEQDISRIKRDIQIMEDKVYLDNEFVRAEKTIPQKEARMRVVLNADTNYKSAVDKLDELTTIKKTYDANILFLQEHLGVVKKAHNQIMHELKIDQLLKESELFKKGD